MNGCHTPPPSPDLWHNTEADSCEGKLLCEYDDAKPDGKQCPFVKFGSEGNYALLEQCAKNRECKDKCESIIGGRPVPLTKECKACIRSHAADGVFHFVCDYCK